MQFNDFFLDQRLVKAVAALGFTAPTMIQEKSIQLALEGKDILGKAKTGSGKTAAYCLPCINKILVNTEAVVGIKSLMLVPTRELAEQVTEHIGQLLAYCHNKIAVVNLTGVGEMAVQIGLLQSIPDIVVSTPSKALLHLDAGNMVLKESLQSLVIDEADLILSFGYEQDVRKIINHLPKVYQAFLMSATLTVEIQDLKQMILRNPVTIKLEEGADEQSQVTQYSVECKESDKFLLAFFILKLRLIKGKCIIFVNDIDRCFRLRLFLEQFSIRACILNSELPQKSRYHIVQEFNKNVFDYLIATDDMKQFAGTEESANSFVKKSKKGKKSKQDKEYGVARGIDFKNVYAVINFDVPSSSRAYTHRIGRTGRGDSLGLALSFVTESDKDIFDNIKSKQKAKQVGIKPFIFDMAKVEGFRYRCEDALRAVTKTAIREARVKEIKSEVLNSELLKVHFQENPTDYAALRHDKPLHLTRAMPHLKHIPEYLIPSRLADQQSKPDTDLNVPFHKNRKQHHRQRLSSGKRSRDPLKSLSFQPGDSSGKKRKSATTATI